MQTSHLNIFDDFTYFDPRADVDVTRRNLPHWRQEGRTYFITFRLHDSLPQEKLIVLRKARGEWLDNNPEPWSPAQRQEYRELFSEKIQQWLDAGHGACILRDPSLAQIVASALKHFDGQRYDLAAWVVMRCSRRVPALISAKFCSLGNHSAPTKSTSERGGKGEVWQHETYDHIVRDPDSLWHFAKYIVDNPRQAGVQIDQVESRIKLT